MAGVLQRTAWNLVGSTAGCRRRDVRQAKRRRLARGEIQGRFSLHVRGQPLALFAVTLRLLRWGPKWGPLCGLNQAHMGTLQHARSQIADWRPSAPGTRRHAAAHRLAAPVDQEAAGSTPAGCMNQKPQRREALGLSALRASEADRDRGDRLGDHGGVLEPMITLVLFARLRTVESPA